LGPKRYRTFCSAKKYQPMIVVKAKKNKQNAKDNDDTPSA
jgi:hypothetical protein